MLEIKGLLYILYGKVCVETLSSKFHCGQFPMHDNLGIEVLSIGGQCSPKMF